VLPVLWEDNYVTLLTGETRELAASYGAKGPRRRLAGGDGRRLDVAWSPSRK